MALKSVGPCAKNVSGRAVVRWHASAVADNHCKTLKSEKDRAILLTRLRFCREQEVAQTFDANVVSLDSASGHELAEQEFQSASAPMPWEPPLPSSLPSRVFGRIFVLGRTADRSVRAESVAPDSPISGTPTTSQPNPPTPRGCSLPPPWPWPPSPGSRAATLQCDG